MRVVPKPDTCGEIAMLSSFVTVAHCFGNPSSQPGAHDSDANFCCPRLPRGEGSLCLMAACRSMNRVHWPSTKAQQWQARDAIVRTTGGCISRDSGPAIPLHHPLEVQHNNKGVCSGPARQHASARRSGQERQRRCRATQCRSCSSAVWGW